jgi:hypothetical protein
MVDSPGWRNQVATGRERIRVIRQESNRTGDRPDWAEVNLVMESLVEVRDQVSQELARRTSDDNLAPIDRDPVPARFTGPVGRYFENLGKE